MQKQEQEQQFVDEVKQHERLIHKVCSVYAKTSVDKKDLFQEIVIQLWQSYPRFKGESKFSTWLYRVAINTAISGLRKEKRLISFYAPEALPIELIDENSSTNDEEQLEQLYRSIQLLSPIEKAIVLLYMEDKSYEEMENILGIGQGNLRVKMNRIKQKLRQMTKIN